MSNYLSVTDYLASVARIPMPTRFERRHQRILQSSKLRLARVSRIIQKDTTNIDSPQNRPYGERNCPLDTSAVALPLDIGSPGSPKIHFTSSSTIEAGQADLAVYDKESDCSQRIVPVFEDDSSCFKDQVAGGSIENDHHLLDADVQEEESGMFISTGSIDLESELTDLERSILHLGSNNEASYGRQKDAESVVPCTPLPSRKRSLPHEQHDASSQDFGTGSACHELEANILPSHKKKLRRPARTNLRSEIAKAPPSIAKASDKQKISRRPRRAPVNELVLYRDLEVLAAGVDTQCEAPRSFEDEDPIEDSENERNLQEKRQARHCLSKSQNPRRNAKFEISGATLDEFSEFKMPKLLQISTNARERLRISPRCCDGFTGREARPTGNLMSMAFPSHRKKRFKVENTVMPALILVPQRSFGHYVQNSQDDSGQYDVCATNSNNPNNRIIITTDGEDHLLDEMVANCDEITKFNHDTLPVVSHQMRQWQRVPDDDGKNSEPAQNLIPPPRSILKNRVTLWGDEKVLQSLSMISAPIARMISNSSNSSDEGTDRGTDDRGYTNSDITDEDRSIESKDEEYDRGSDSNTDEEAEVIQPTGRELLPEPKTPTRVAIQVLEPEDAFTPSSEITVTQAVQRLALSEELIFHDVNTVFEDLFYPQLIGDDSDMQRCQRQETPEKTVELRPKLDVPDLLPWMPRRPVSTRCLIEVDEDIEDTSSPIAARLSRSPVRAGDAVGDCIEKTPFSQDSIELGDPNWSAPCCQTEALEFQSQSPERSEEYWAISRQEFFLQASQQPFQILSRSATVPLNSRPPWSAEAAKVEHLGADFAYKQSSRPVILPRRQSLSQPHAEAVRTTVMMSRKVEPGTAPVRGRIRSLPLKPPFLRA